MGKTFTEKVLGRAMGKEVVPNDIVIVEPDFCLSHENASAVASTFKKIGLKKVWNPDKILVVFDHTVPASTSEYADSQKVTREFVTEQGIQYFHDMHKNGGICHQIVCQEGYACPGSIIVGTDSHTCTAGAMGAFATGIGRSEMAAIWAIGTIWLAVPQSIKVNVNGRFQPGVSAKDFILKLIGDIKADGANYKALEFHGQGIRDMSIAERMTICNMAIECGAKNAVCEPDAKVIAHAKAKGKVTTWQAVWADDDAVYFQVLDYELDSLVPGVAVPHTVDNYAQVEHVVGVAIDQAFIGTCTNGRIEDLRLAAGILKGKKVKVRTIVIPASVEVYRMAIAEGLVTTFLDAGCMVGHPSCGPCIGVYGGVLAEDETCISTANRNFCGRMGAKTSRIYLASPLTVAVSALQGCISDPREAL